MWGALSDVATAYAAYRGTQETNQANMAIARENRDWQERMSNTAHVREVRDLRKAGLNPILSGMGGSGASTPAGSTATMDNAIGNAVTTAMASRRLRQDIQQSQANIDKTKSETEKTKQEEKNLLLANDLINEQVSTARESRLNLQADTALKMSQQKESNAKAIMLSKEIPAASAEAQVKTDIYEGLMNIYNSIFKSSAPVNTPKSPRFEFVKPAPKQSSKQKPSDHNWSVWDHVKDAFLH